MTSRVPDAADPFEEEGQASQEPGLPGKRITGDPQDDMAVPGDQPQAVDEFGTTAAEQRAGEPLGARVEREEPDLTPEHVPDEATGADNPYPEAPDERAGRIVEPDQGGTADVEADAVGTSVGTDEGGFSAEERAMHVEPEA